MTSVLALPQVCQLRVAKLIHDDGHDSDEFGAHSPESDKSGWRQVAVHKGLFYRFNPIQHYKAVGLPVFPTVRSLAPIVSALTQAFTRFRVTLTSRVRDSVTESTNIYTREHLRVGQDSES